MFLPIPPRMETQRLILRPLALSDAPNYFSYLFGDPEIARFMLWQPHKSLDESVQSIQTVLRRYEAGESCRWAIARKEEDALMGIAELLRFEGDTCSFAYMVGQPFQGQGYATEALTAVFDYAFRVLPVQTIRADHFAANPASGAVMRKLGMTCLQTLPARYEKDGQYFDAVEYAISRADWISRRPSLSTFSL